MPSLRSKRDSSVGLLAEESTESSQAHLQASPSPSSIKSKLTPSKSKRSSFFSRSNHSPSPSSSPSPSASVDTKATSPSTSPSTIISKGLPTVGLNGHHQSDRHPSRSSSPQPDQSMKSSFIPHQVSSRPDTMTINGYEDAKRDVNRMNGMLIHGTEADQDQMEMEMGDGGDQSPNEGSQSNKSSNSSSEPPSMTTASTATSASVESLESIRSQNESRALKLKLDRSLATNHKEASLQPIAQLIPPNSHESSSDGTELLHQEFGYCSNQTYRYTSQHRVGDSLPNPIEEEPSYFIVLSTYVSYLILIVIGHMRDYVGKRLFPNSYKHLVETNGYAALNSDFDSFYTRRLKARLDDCFSRPVTGVCGRTVLTLDRISNDYFESFQLTGEKTRALNISAYNYLGFAQSHGGCADAVEVSLKKYGVSSFSSRLGVGSLDLHKQAENLVARFVGQEDSIIISMGFATNSTTIPAIAGPGTLIISDEYNHSSIRFGARLSGASIRQYKHNDMRELENLLKECISQGMPRTHRPWKKILLLVEGLYSMEGTLVNLPEVMKLKEKYKFYLYVDEAHSIGAIGPNGRGVCDYFGVDPEKIDILMGTFTKSFGASGGYISGSKVLMDRIRLSNHANVYGETLAPPVLTQIIASMASIMGVGNDPTERALLPSWISLPNNLLNGSEGKERLRRLAFNARYLSSGLRKLGFIVYGHRDSPIVPLLIFNPSKMPMFSRMMLDRQSSLPPHERRNYKLLSSSSHDELTPEEKASIELESRSLHDPKYSGEKTSRPPIVVVVVAYPATPLISSRVRFCVSASHTKNDMDDVLRAVDEVGTLLSLKLGTGGPGGRWDVEKVIQNPEKLVQWNGEDAI